MNSQNIENFKTSSINYVKYTYKTYRTPIVITLILLFFFIIFIRTIFGEVEPDINSASFITSIFLSISAFIFALFTTVKDWHDSFSKYMNITFYFEREKEKEEIVIMARNLFLAGESDIRPWAQQIAKQATTLGMKSEYNEEYLALLPKFEISSELQRKEEKIIYEVKMYLWEKPKNLEDYDKKTNSIHYIDWDILSKEGIQPKPYPPKSTMPI